MEVSEHAVIARAPLWRRLWQGEVPLALAYWVFGVLVPVPLWQVLLHLPPHTAASGIAAAGLLAYLVFSWVAIWRAANRYTGPKVWAALARIAVLLSAAALALPILISLALK